MFSRKLHYFSKYQFEHVVIDYDQDYLFHCALQKLVRV